MVDPFENKIDPLVNAGNENLLLKVVQSVFVKSPVALEDALEMVVQVGALDEP